MSRWLRHGDTIATPVLNNKASRWQCNTRAPIPVPKIHHRHTRLYLYKFNHRKKERSNIYTVYQICLQYLGVSWYYCKQWRRFTIDWDVFCSDCKHGGSVVHNGIKTITSSESNQALTMVYTPSRYTNQHCSKTDTRASFFFVFFCQATEMHWAVDLLLPWHADRHPPPAGRHSRGEADWSDFSLLFAAHLTGPYHKGLYEVWASTCHLLLWWRRRLFFL